MNELRPDPLECLEQNLRVLMAKNQELSRNLEISRLQSELEIKNILQSFLEVLDDLEGKVKKSRSRLDSGDKKAQKILSRFQGVQKKFRKTLENFGVAPVKAKEGKKVAPDRHIVVETRKGPAEQAGTIYKEIKRGYTWQGKILRPAEVRAYIERKEPEAIE